MEIAFFPDRGSNPVRWTQSPTLYHVAIKAGLYRKAVQVYHIPIPGDILPLQFEIRPWISRSSRITWYETQGVLCTHVGYLRWAPNVTGEKMETIFFPRPGIEPGRSTWQTNTLPSRYKSRLVPQGSTSVIYIYTRWQIYSNHYSFLISRPILKLYSSCIKLNSFLSTLLQDILTTYFAFPFLIKL